MLKPINGIGIIKQQSNDLLRNKITFFVNKLRKFIIMFHMQLLVLLK